MTRPWRADGPAGQQLVAPVAAHVGEGPQDPVLAPGQEDPGRRRRLGPLVPGLGHVLAAARRTSSRRSKKCSLLPGEDGRVDIGGPGQHPALAERAGASGSSSAAVERGGIPASV